MFGFSKERSLQRAMNKVMNKHAQSPDRWAAMEKLGKDGSEEALYALTRRFSYAYDKTIEDAQEKQWVVDTLISKGAASLPGVRRYMKDAKSLHYPLIVMGRVAPIETCLEIIDDLLADEPPGYTRDPERRADLIAWLGECDASNEDVSRRCIPYLADFDENVRYKAVDSIALKPHPVAAGPLVDALIREEEESRRLRVRIGEVMAENQWDLGDKKSEVSALMEPGKALEQFKMHHDKLQR